jgi:hypothetical protein
MGPPGGAHAQCSMLHQRSRAALHAPPSPPCARRQKGPRIYVYELPPYLNVWCVLCALRMPRACRACCRAACVLCVLRWGRRPCCECRASRVHAFRESADMQEEK